MASNLHQEHELADGAHLTIDWVADRVLANRSKAVTVSAAARGAIALGIARPAPMVTGG